MKRACEQDIIGAERKWEAEGSQETKFVAGRLEELGSSL